MLPKCTLWDKNDYTGTCEKHTKKMCLGCLAHDVMVTFVCISPCATPSVFLASQFLSPQ
jgi:hypothetical protein